MHGERSVYESEWMSLSLVDVELPSGKRFEHHVLRMPCDAAGVVVDDPERGVLLLWRHRFISDTWGWEVPAGRVDPGETPEECAARETLEETGWTVVPTALVGVYRWEAADNGATYVRFTFVGEAREHDTGRALDAGIVRALWLTYDEIAARDAAHRSPLVLRCIDDYRAGKRYPVDLVTEVAVQRSLWETS